MLKLQHLDRALRHEQRAQELANREEKTMPDPNATAKAPADLLAAALKNLLWSIQHHDVNKSSGLGVMSARTLELAKTEAREALDEYRSRPTAPINAESRCEPFGYVSEHNVEGPFKFQFHRTHETVYTDNCKSITPVFAAQPSALPAMSEEEPPLTEADAIQLWKEDHEAHHRTSAFEWFCAGIIAGERAHGIGGTGAAEVKA